MRQRTAACITALLSIACCGAPVHAGEVRSPDGDLAVRFEVTPFEGTEGCLVYSVSYRGKPILADSRLGFRLKGSALGGGLEIVARSSSQHDRVWKPVYGERSTVRDRHRQSIVELKEAKPPHRAVHVTFRAYDEGVAFRYTIPKQPGLERIQIAAERSEFRFLGDHAACRRPWTMVPRGGSGSPAGALPFRTSSGGHSRRSGVRSRSVGRGPRPEVGTSRLAPC